MKKALLVLEDGSVFHGEPLGVLGRALGEVVFQTAMCGYQEILTDPSYYGQMVAMTYPQIGNVGINAFDHESDKVHAQGLIIRQNTPIVSNWRAEKDLNTFLKEVGCVGIAGVDTRQLTHVLREKGAMNGCIVSDDTTIEEAQQLAVGHPSLNHQDCAQHVTTPQPYKWTQSIWQRPNDLQKKPAPQYHFHVVVMDFGVKRSILRACVANGAQVTVVPAQTCAQKILELKPDGVLLSNGPGDPAPCQYAIDTIAQLIKQQVPLFGICLGFQLMALALGAKTQKMKFGHHGGNHPVQDLQTEKVFYLESKPWILC